MTDLGTLNAKEWTKLEELVFQREFNPSHEDDYSNAGGFGGHWHNYTEEEQAELLKEIRG